VYGDFQLALKNRSKYNLPSEATPSTASRSNQLFCSTIAARNANMEIDMRKDHCACRRVATLALCAGAVGLAACTFTEESSSTVRGTISTTEAHPLTASCGYRVTLDVDDADNGGSDNASVLVANGNRFFGTALGSAAAEYEHVAKYFSQITPGNAGKWGSVESSRDQMNWRNLDAAYAFAQDNDLRFKMHTLVWGQQQPGWINELPVEEQLAEIDEWMAAVAERYPRLGMIDVVNEPLHAPPDYHEALGGAGETGWDWVVTSFEMARAHFPDSELILNDYNVLLFEAFTADYLEVIDVLHERGLIDGIGVQAHFLERAEVPTVAANLDKLAATGLPIYISELDLNFANDARHANVMSELFTVFWEHPSVVGVTHWGHLQGLMWRENAYLINEDGTPRPAMDWLTCTLADGADCVVPDYVPEPRRGGSSGITLEAEEYDAAEGVLALGSIVAHTDAGDFIAFYRVVFDVGWDRLALTYAKGNDNDVSVSIHLGSLDAPAVVEIPLPTTGGWGSSDTIEVPWAPISGEQEVYIRFNGDYGVGNIDKIAFAAPQEPRPNLVANSDFESGSAGWFSWSGGVVSSTESRAHSGFRSLVVTNRSSNAPAATSLTNAVAAGRSYTVSAWVSIGGLDSGQVNVTRKLLCDGAASYSWLGQVSVKDGEWREITGTLDIPDCDRTELILYAEGAIGANLYVDDVVVR
jgi:GH35 family endo-1,4-beta-xylanase